MGFLSAKSYFIHEIFMTKEFNALRLAKNKLFENKEHVSLVSDFNKKRNAALISGEEKALAEVESEYRELAATPEIRMYFNAAAAMAELVAKITEDINNAIDNNLK